MHERKWGVILSEFARWADESKDERESLGVSDVLDGVEFLRGELTSL
ncbi:MAG TPA: hypothetical protein VMG34_08710 [Bacteroidota bacterium]|nr:hypothetical protein [Bacteroidota bacterium]